MARQRGVSAELKGLGGLEKKLEALAPALAGKVLRGALRNAAKLVREEALTRIPSKTGRTRRALKVRAARRRKRGAVAIELRIGRDGFFQGDEFYAGFVEFGTGERRTRKGARRGRVKARHGLQGSFEAAKDRALESVRRDVAAGLESIAKEI